MTNLCLGVTRPMVILACSCCKSRATDAYFSMFGGVADYQRIHQSESNIKIITPVNLILTLFLNKAEVF